MAFVTDNFQLVQLANNASMASDFRTEYQDMRTFDIMCIQAIWTGANGLVLTPAKVWIEGSLDGLNYCNVFPDAVVKKVTSANGCLMYTFDAVGWIYQRVYFEHNGCTTGGISFLSFAKRRRANNP
jgi:hypothetical protein